jgi:hypothetical protein
MCTCWRVLLSYATECCATDHYEQHAPTVGACPVAVPATRLWGDLVLQRSNSTTKQRKNPSHVKKQQDAHLDFAVAANHL